MYERDIRDRFRANVEMAIAQYKDDLNNIGAGTAIIGYVKRGLIQVDKTVDPQIFLDWYPLNQGFIFLRLARDGKLSYKEQTS